MQSQAKTATEYLRELPADRRQVIAAVRQVILENLDQDIEEGMQYGMIAYVVPFRVYPSGYHCDPRMPLPFACLASQKNYMSLYLYSTYCDAVLQENFIERWKRTGKKLDMGKCCLRFKKLDDLALDVIADVIRQSTALKFIEYYETSLKNSRTRSARSATQAAKKSASPQKKKSARSAVSKPAASRKRSRTK